MQSLAPFVSVLVISAYLAAACLDCEPIVSTYGWVPMLAASSDGHHGLVPETLAAEVHVDRHTGHDIGRNTGHITGHDADDRSVHHNAEEAVHSGGHGPAHGHDGTVDANAHAGHDARGAPPARLPTSARSNFKDLRAAGLAFVPTCLCGCSETRSTVGGNVSRLGSVVPGVFVAWRTQVDAQRHFFPPSGGLVGITLDLDPIPI